MDITVQEAIKKGSNILEEAGVVNAKFEATLLLRWILKWEKHELIINSQKKLTSKEVENYLQQIKLRAKGYPLQYITEEQEFMGFKFRVTPDVLIPRYDTEILVETALKLDIPENAVVIDVGTGSGIIPISLYKFRPTWRLFAIDISDAALNIAAENCQRLNAKVSFLKGDLLQPVLTAGIKPDLIISNPPYIPSIEMKNLMKEVQHEPELALNGGIDGLDFYRKIIPQAHSILTKKGYMLLEIGYNQGKDVVQLCKDAGFNGIEIIKDYQNHDRVVVANKNVMSYLSGINF